MTPTQPTLELTDAQRRLAGPAAVFAPLAPRAGEPIAAEAASLPTLALIVAGLLGQPAHVAEHPGHAPLHAPAPHGSAQGEDPAPEAPEAADALPAASLHAHALLRAWHASCTDGTLTRYRVQVLERPSFEAFMFDPRLPQVPGGNALAGVIIDSDRPLHIQLSATSQGAIATPQPTRDSHIEAAGHPAALCLEPGDAATLVDPSTGDAVVLVRDLHTSQYAWSATPWSWVQAQTALQDAPLPASWVQRALQDAAAPSGDAGDALAWLGAQLRAAPRDRTLTPIEARQAWFTWRAAHITASAKGLAEAHTTDALAALEGLIDALLPAGQLLEAADEPEGIAAPALHQALDAPEFAQQIEQINTLRERIASLMQIGGPLADPAHALPRVDRKLGRLRAQLHPPRA